MRIKLDENLPTALVSVLASLGHDVDTVPSERVAGASDPEVWRAAQRSKRFLITQDLDFSDIRRFAPGTHAGLLLVRLREPGRLALTNRVAELFGSEDVTSWAGCFLVVTARKPRIRRPSTST